MIVVRALVKSTILYLAICGLAFNAVVFGLVWR